MEEAAKKDKMPVVQLPGIGDLLKRTWHLYRERMWTLLALLLAAAMMSAVGAAVPIVLGYLLMQTYPDFKNVILVATVVVAFGEALWVSNWGASAFLTAVADRQCGLREAFSRARSRVLAQIWLVLITGVILTGAHLFLIIPGIVFTVWFVFAPFVLVEEGTGGMNALLKSKACVEGRWFSVALRLLAIWVVALIVSAVPVVGQILALFLIPFSFVYTYVLFADLRASRSATGFRATKKAKLLLLTAACLGYATPALVLFALMGSMMLMPFSVLTAKLTDDALFLNATAGDRSFSGANPTKVRIPIAASPGDPGQEAAKYLQNLRYTNPDWTARSNAAAFLGDLGDKSAVEPLIEALNSDDQWMVRQNAAKALGRLGDLRALHQLIESLGGDENVFVRAEAAKALGALGDKRAIGALKKALADEGIVTDFSSGKGVEVREAAVAAESALKLLDEKSPDAVPAVHGATGPAAHSGTLAPPAPLPATQNAGHNFAQPTAGEPATYEGPIQDWNRKIAVESDKAAAYLGRAVAFHKQGRYEQALADLDESVRRDPENHMAYYNRAIVHGVLGKHEEAVRDGSAAIELNPRHSDAYVNRGIDYTFLGEFDKALKDLDQAISLNPADPQAHYARGVVHYWLRSPDKALTDFQESARLGHGQAKAYLSSLKSGA